MRAMLSHLSLRALLCLALVIGTFPPSQAGDSTAGTGVQEPGWATASPGWKYLFPRDHFTHPTFKTEWWYFTGNVMDAAGRRFGYQVTFFRHGLRPPSARAGTTSHLLMNDLPFAHFALSDPAGNHFSFEQQIRRGSFGEAGYGKEGDALVAWNGDWKLALNPDGSFHCIASSSEASIDLELVSTKPWAMHGADGISQKAAGVGHASHYYSGTRLQSHGTVTVGGVAYQVKGESWFDHEWATNQLAPGQAGWNWLSIQLADGTELMLYQMRLKDGTADPASSGTFVARDGTCRHLTSAEFTLTPGTLWKSTKTKASYPVEWHASVPLLGVDLHVTTPMKEQEMALGAIDYWEGMIDVRGTSQSKPVTGRGYLEMTGYAKSLAPLMATEAKPTP